MNEWFEAEQRVERAQQFSESQRWEEALTELDAALSINPNNAAWHAHRGFILEELERWKEAAGAYRASLDLEPGDADVTMALGVALSRLGRYAEALEIFERLAKQRPDFEPAYCHRIPIYTELGQHAKAEEMFYLAQALNDACPHCFFAIGSSLSARGQTDRAIFCWQRVLEIDPGYYGVNSRIAQAYRVKGNAQAAREYYLRELRDDPGDTDLLFELAELAWESGDAATAAAKCVQIIELDPSHLEAYFLLGTVWLRRREPQRALKCFEHVATLADGDPALGSFDLRYGEALLAAGRFAEARDRLAKAAERDPETAEIAVLQGRCLLALNKPDEAADAFRRAIARDANDGTSCCLLALCHLKRDRADAALDHCLRALDLKPDDVGAMHTAVGAYVRLARWREARAMIRRALRHDPHHAELLALGKRLWRIRVRHVLRRAIDVLTKLRA